MSIDAQEAPPAFGYGRRDEPAAPPISNPHFHADDWGLPRGEVRQPKVELHPLEKIHELPRIEGESDAEHEARKIEFGLTAGRGWHDAIQRSRAKRNLS